MIEKVSKHIWTMLMHKILQIHLLRAFVAYLKIDTIYVLYPESFCNKNLAIRKVFAFCDSVAVVRQSLPTPPLVSFKFIDMFLLNIIC